MATTVAEHGVESATDLNADEWDIDVPELDWDISYDPAALLPHGLTMNCMLYTREDTAPSQDGNTGALEFSESEVMVPALEEDSWWYSDAVAADSIYDEWYLSSGDWVSTRPRSRRYRGAFNPRSVTKDQVQPSRASFETRCGDDDDADFEDALPEDADNGMATPIYSVPGSSDEAEFHSCPPTDDEVDIDTPPEVVNSNVGIPRVSAVEMELQRLSQRSVREMFYYHQMPAEHLEFFKDADRTAEWNDSDTNKTGNKTSSSPELGSEAESEAQSSNEKEMEAVKALMKRVQGMYLAGTPSGQMPSRSKIDGNKGSDKHGEIDSANRDSESDSDLETLEKRVSAESHDSWKTAREYLSETENESNTEDVSCSEENSNSQIGDIEEPAEHEVVSKPTRTPSSDKQSESESPSTLPSRIPIPTRLVESLKRSSLASLDVSSNICARTRNPKPFFQLVWMDMEEVEGPIPEPESLRNAVSMDELQEMLSRESEQRLLRGSNDSLVCSRCLTEMEPEAVQEAASVSNSNPGRKPTVVEKFQASCSEAFSKTDTKYANANKSKFYENSANPMDSMQFIYPPNVMNSLDSKTSFVDQSPQASGSSNAGKGLNKSLKSIIADNPLDSKKSRASEQSKSVSRVQGLNTSSIGKVTSQSVPSVQSPRFHPYQSVAQRMAQLRESSNLTAEPRGIMEEQCGFSQLSSDEDRPKSRSSINYDLDINLDSISLDRNWPADSAISRLLRSANISGSGSAASSSRSSVSERTRGEFSSSKPASTARTPKTFQSKIPVPSHHLISVSGIRKCASEATTPVGKPLTSKIPVYRPLTVNSCTQTTRVNTPRKRFPASAGTPKTAKPASTPKLPATPKPPTSKIPVLKLTPSVRVPATPETKPKKTSRIPTLDSRRPATAITKLTRIAANFDLAGNQDSIKQARPATVGASKPVKPFGYPVKKK